MKITVDEVRYVAGLANLTLAESEVEKLRADLDEILDHIGKLNELDTTGVEPMSQVLFDAEATATLREDHERAPLDNRAALANAAQSGHGHFKVPKVFERS